jgi:uncharacterized membrane protein YraQ (UPF0718 family)
MTLVLLGGFYVTMVIGGYIVELLFGGLGLVPPNSQAKVIEQGIQWNYTTWLNIIALLLTAVLLVRFFRTGGREMMAMMNGNPDDMDHHDHTGHDAGTEHGEHTSTGHGDHHEDHRRV